MSGWRPGMRIPDGERYQGRCQNCGADMWMPSVGGWPSDRSTAQRRWCSRECRNQGNRREAKQRKEAQRGSS